MRIFLTLIFELQQIHRDALNHTEIMGRIVILPVELNRFAVSGTTGVPV